MAIFDDSFRVILGNCDKDYFLAGSGNLCRDADGERIENSAECRDAANKIGKVFNSEEEDANYPSGCYVFCNVPENCGLHVYFNSNANNVSHVKGNPICKKKAEGKILR